MKFLDSLTKDSNVALKHRLARTVLAVTAGILAQEVARKGYDKFIFDTTQEVLAAD